MITLCILNLAIFIILTALLFYTGSERIEPFIIWITMILFNIVIASSLPSIEPYVSAIINIIFFIVIIVYKHKIRVNTQN